ncbi:MAG: hypothetical protein ACOYLB_01105 [Phototrophicaceae bacterium]
MDISFFESGGVPRPRAEVKIEEVHVKPYPDGFRVHINIVVTPFQERPNLVLVIHNEQDSIVSELNIIETMHHNMEFTMHLRGVTNPIGVYSLTVELFYENRIPAQDKKIVGFKVEQSN